MNKKEHDELFKEPTVSGSTRLDAHRVLVLNADFRPFSYWPLSTANWQQIMFLYVKGLNTGVPRFNIVAYYDDIYVHGGTNKQGDPTRIQLPSVIANLQYLSPPSSVSITKKNNVYLRDDFMCQYSGERCHVNDLSWDHVVPRDHGGTTAWNNIASAKKKINELKDNMTVKEFEKAHGYVLNRKPYEPTWGELYNKGKKYPPSYLHSTWHDYLYWETMDLID
jgi:5-methylcytosine-specific restriction endonuclease McrA